MATSTRFLDLAVQVVHRLFRADRHVSNVTTGWDPSGGGEVRFEYTPSPVLATVRIDDLDEFSFRMMEHNVAIDWLTTKVDEAVAQARGRAVFDQLHHTERLLMTPRQRMRSIVQIVTGGPLALEREAFEHRSRDDYELQIIEHASLKLMAEYQRLSKGKR